MTVDLTVSQGPRWGQTTQHIVEVDVLDSELLRHAFKLLQLASEARQVLLPTPAHQLRIVMKDQDDVLLALHEGRVGAARSLLSSSTAADARWGEVLAPPSATTQPKTGRSDFDRNADWLRANGRRYRGMWVAVYEGELVGADTSRVALHRRLEVAGKLVEGTLFAKVA